MTALYSYQGTWALITGAGRGMGAATAKWLARQGVHLLLHYHSSEQKVREVADECREQGVDVELISADLSQKDQVKALIKQLPIMPDYLINNAGIAHYGLFTDTTDTEWEALLNVNVSAPMMLCRSLLPSMIRKRFGRIVNLSSVWGSTGAACEVLYATTKGAIDAFTRSVAKEVASNNITVNAIAPGAIATDMVIQEFDEADLQQLATDIPTGRLGTPDEVAGLIVYLLSDQAAYITGQIIRPDGGWM